MSQPAWVPCDCDEFWCTIHQQHVYECDCPSIDQWDVDPYATGGPDESAEESERITEERHI